MREQLHRAKAKSLFLGVMGTPYQSELTTSLFRMVDAALGQEHDVTVWTCGYGTMLTQDTLTAEQVLRCLPHRYPYLLVDRIDAYAPGQWIRGSKNIAAWEPMLVPPGIEEYPVGLVIESIGQIAIALYNLSRTRQPPPEILLGAINDVTIERPVPLGCRLELYAEVGKELDNGFIFSGEASIDGQRVLSLGNLIAIEKP